MHVLLLAATENEIALTLRELGAKWAENGVRSFKRGDLTIDVVITGIGSVRTTYALTKAVGRKKPDLCINIGIAGAFPGKFNIGDVVHVVSDAFADLGARDAAGDFLSLSEMNLEEDIPNDQLINTTAAAFNFLPKAHGITVNTVHGDLRSILTIQERLDPDIETMESAAVFYICLKEEINFLCIRSISNIVEPRNRSNWEIEKAISNLNAQLVEILVFLTA